MEYRLGTTGVYTAVTGTSIDNLAAGTYTVRYAAKAGFNASPDTTVVVTENLIAIQFTIDAIDALPLTADIVISDLAQINAARLSYDNLSSAEQSLVTNLATLVATEAEIAILQADNTNPTVVGVADGAYYNSDVTITFSDANLLSATLQLGLGAPSVFVSGTTISVDGQYTLVVTDRAGNTTTVHFVIDKINPVVTGVTDGGLYATSVTLTFSDSNLAGATLNGNPITSGTVVSADNTYVLIVTDMAGNQTVTNFTIDSTLPIISGVVNGTYYSGNVVITYSGVYVTSATLNGAPYTSGTVISNEGSYVFIVTDSVHGTYTYNFTIDSTDPVVTGVTNNAIYSGSVTITATDLNLASITLNGNPFASGTIVSGDGVYVLVATDLAGNTITINFTIDTVYPVVTGVVNNSQNSGAVTINVTDANIATITLNGNAFVSGTTVSGDGTYVLIATDLAGNVTTVNFKIDTIAPTITGVVHNAKYINTVTVNVVDVNIASITLNGVAFVSGSSISADGVYTIIATDLAGNTTTVTFAIDKTAPVISGIVNNANYTGPVTITVADANIATITLNGVLFTSGSTVSSEGSYVLAATDFLGNVTTVNFKIEKAKEVVYVYSTQNNIQTNDDDEETVTIPETTKTENEDISVPTNNSSDDSDVSSEDGSMNTWILVIVPISLTILIIGYWIIAKR